MRSVVTLIRAPHTICICVRLTTAELLLSTAVHCCPLRRARLVTREPAEAEQRVAAAVMWSARNIRIKMRHIKTYGEVDVLILLIHSRSC